MFHTSCPSCRNSISFKEKLQAGQNTVCPNCKELLVVTTLDPFDVELYAFRQQNEWGSAEKQEAAKKHQRKNKHRRDSFDDYEDEDEVDWRKRKSKSTKKRTQLDW